MKNKFAIIILLSGVVVVFYQFTGEADHSTNGDESVSVSVGEQKRLTPSVTSYPESAEEVFEDLPALEFLDNFESYDYSAPENVQLMANEKEREIDLLIHEFNSHISDVGMRDSLKIKIDKALAEYNKIILPFAVEQVRASN